MRDDAPAVDAALVLAGSPEGSRAIAQLARLNQTACDRILAIACGVVRVPVGAPGGNGRAVAEDVSDAVTIAARSWPRRFVAVVAGDEDRYADSLVLWALRHVDSPASIELLTRALDRTAAGNQFRRWAALSSLLALPSAVPPKLLSRALTDRASLVRGVAIEAAARWGDTRHLPRLRMIADRATEAPGHREQAAAAIEAITFRDAVSGQR